MYFVNHIFAANLMIVTMLSSSDGLFVRRTDLSQIPDFSYPPSCVIKEKSQRFINSDFTSRVISVKSKYT